MGRMAEHAEPPTESAGGRSWRESIAPAPSVGLTPVPSLVTGDAEIDRAFRIALGDIVSNIAYFQDGLLSEPAQVLLAGLGYVAPWTRDAAINTWNGTGLLCPEVTRNTLLSVVTERDGQPIIGGQYSQYWDSIIWVLGAWAQYLYTGDRAWLAFAFETSRNSICHMEETEFDSEMGLFRGPAVYGDGIAAYPDIYTRTNGSSAILDWVAANPDLQAPKGFGLPMFALSTNCLYAAVYMVLREMEHLLGMAVDPAWLERRKALRSAIYRHFWDEATQRLRYLVDPFGGSDAQEGLGNAFALIFNIPGASELFTTQHITPAGIPCIWPTFPRYENPDGTSFGRHSGTVWPFIQAFWAEGCVRWRQWEKFEFEMRQLASHISRDAQCAEIYQPFTGESYGGVQERDGVIAEWESLPRQTWSASGFLRMVLMGLFGMDFRVNGFQIRPSLLTGMEHIELRNLRYRGLVLNITAEGHGHRVAFCGIDGKQVTMPAVSGEGTGERNIHIKVG